MSSTLTAPRNDTTTATTTEPTEPIRAGMTTRTLRAFFALAFGLGWGIAALMVVFQDQVEAIFGEISMTNPVFILVVYSPAMAGILLVWRHYGREGLRSYFRRVTMWHMPRAWWAFLIVGIPAIVYTGAAISGTATEFDFSPWYGVFGALGITLIIGPVEEFGWRGVALPLLQRRFAPLWSALILGAFWGLWHAPAFLLSGTKQASWSFPAFVIGVLALAVIVTPMFNAAQGSILIAGLFHFQVNGPVWPDAQPWDTLVYVVAAILVVVLNRKTMLTRGSGVTDVLMQGDEERLRLPAIGNPEADS